MSHDAGLTPTPLLPGIERRTPKRMSAILTTVDPLQKNLTAKPGTEPGISRSVCNHVTTKSNCRLFIVMYFIVYLLIISFVNTFPNILHLQIIEINSTHMKTRPIQDILHAQETQGLVHKRVTHTFASTSVHGLLHLSSRRMRTGGGEMLFFNPSRYFETLCI